MAQDIESIKVEMARVREKRGNEPATLSGHQWVRVMCDYCAGGALLHKSCEGFIS